MDEKSGPLKMLRTKGLAQAQSSRLYIFYFSDPRSHCVYRKSQYYQGGMRCCLMRLLLKMLSDMLQSPQPLSHIHICPKTNILGKLNEWHGMDDESGSPKISRTKDWLKLKSSRLFILYFSDPRSH